MDGVEDAKLPDDKVLIPGVIDTCTNYVEHPELVAQRHGALANAVGERARDGRHRLRFRHVCRLQQGGSRHCVEEVARDRARRGDRVQAAVELMATETIF